MSPRHRNDLALKAALHDIPLALVDHKWSLSLLLRIPVGLGDDPRWRIRYTQIQDLSGHNELMKAVHNFLNRRVEVPPVQVQDVDVVCTEI